MRLQPVACDPPNTHHREKQWQRAHRTDPGIRSWSGEDPDSTAVPVGARSVQVLAWPFARRPGVSG